MKYSAKQVANAFLDIAKSESKSLSPLKLQKLVYIAHGWSLAIYEEPLVGDEFPEAWQYGPVFPSIYHEFKSFGRGSVDAKARELEKSGSGFLDFNTFVPEIPVSDQRTWDFLKTVWQKYGHFSGLALSDATHRADTPWSIVWNESDGARNADIKNDLIRNHYLSLAKSRTSAGEAQNK